MKFNELEVFGSKDSRKKSTVKTLRGSRLSRQEKLLLELFDPTQEKQHTQAPSSRISSSLHPERKIQPSRPLPLIQDSSSIITLTKEKFRSVVKEAASRTSLKDQERESSRSPFQLTTTSPDISFIAKATWNLIPLELTPIRFTRPPLHRLTRWDRRARYPLSPRFKEEERENEEPKCRLNARERRKLRRKLLFNVNK